MLEELGPRYDTKEVEERIYKLWEKSGVFNPDNLPQTNADKTRKDAEKIRRKSAFCIMMPPNNANGLLHMGHAVGLTLQDILIRFWRMRGRKTLWLPGADHAGFETQVVFDKKLDKEGRNRFVMGREELWKEIWDFTQENKKKMYEQTKKLGASCDWSRETFTLDPKIIETVYETFEKLYKDGLVYRDLKVINWCPKHRTALSDLEVKFVEREDPLYYIKYGPLTLATVRPETKFGDTALAVNPKDKRYAKYIGKEIEAKGILGTLKFKVVGDEAVDPKFGTGVVKVTPAHDATDFEIWQRHKKEISGPKIIIDEAGKLTGEVGEYAGLKVAEAREKIAAKMQEIGILEKVEVNYKHQVATCYKCGNTLEPLPRPQWFVRMTEPAKSQIANSKSPTTKKSLRDMAVEAVKSGKIKFHPERSEKVFLHWMKNLRDWNISRQIVWGIRIPAWFCISCGESKINAKIKSKWFIIRHGETDANKNLYYPKYENEVLLNETGIKQVENLAETLKSSDIDLIISSDLTRTKQTAEIIAKKLGVEIIYDNNLRERDVGEWSGKTFEEVSKEYGQNSWTRLGLKPSGGETWEDLEKRIWEAFTKHHIKYKHRNVAIVTHGGAIRMLSKKLKAIGFDEAMNLRHIDNGGVIKIDVEEKCKKCSGDLYEQDPDVFDTWFSSGQWPFAALMSGKNLKLKNKNEKLGKDFETFYPTDVMETGYDILFFWVARMVMLGLYRTGKVPFRDVYLHGLVRDKDRQKMSKSKGNVIDPLGVADTYGTDAVRMALVTGNTPGNDIVISEDKIRGYRNFATKIWNVARFILMNKSTRINTNEKTKGARNKIILSPADKKDLAQLKKIHSQVTKHIEKFEFHLAAEKIYHYIWHTFADKIIEASKARLVNEPSEILPAKINSEFRGANGKTRDGKNSKDAEAAYLKLETILIESLKMLHPFMPYVTEEIFQKFRPGEILMVEPW